MPRTSSRFCSSVGQRPSSVVWRDAVEVDRVVGHQAVAARDQLQAQFALAQARLAGDQHAHAQDVHEHAVHRGALGDSCFEVDAHQVDHVAGRSRRRRTAGSLRGRRCATSGRAALRPSADDQPAAASDHVRRITCAARPALTALVVIRLPGARTPGCGPGGSGSGGRPGRRPRRRRREIRRSPPGKPANQPSCRLSRLSSYSLWMVSGVCSIVVGYVTLAHRLKAGLPVDDALVDRAWILVGGQRGAHGFVREQFGDLGQDFQVLLGHVIRDQQEESAGSPAGRPAIRTESAPPGGQTRPAAPSGSCCP